MNENKSPAERQSENIPRDEPPRPDFYRKQWLSLNGEWEFDFFDYSRLFDITEFWGQTLTKKITVPFPYQSKLSGIGETALHTGVVYRRNFRIPKEWENRRVFLHFGAVDYYAKVWLNERLVGEHIGGHVPFHFAITEFLGEDDNEIVVQAEDPLDTDQPRGKQSWSSSFGVFYTQTTGIWQPVWLEATGESAIASLRCVPDLPSCSCSVEITIGEPADNLTVEAVCSFEGQEVDTIEASVRYPSCRFTFSIPEPKLWSPEQPDLYDVTITLRKEGRELDRIESYFGMRSITIEQGQVCLNGKPYYQRLILDQGYWPDGIYTAPADDSFRTDIECAKAMGFNGCRKHMKVEDPRFLYWADKLGFLVWGEFPAYFSINDTAKYRFLKEWLEAVVRDINHPSIVAWTPFNESWGIRSVATDPAVQRWVMEVVRATKALDPTRLVIDNDGWEHIDSDILGFHDYAFTGDDLLNNFQAMIEQAKNPQEGEKGRLPHGKKLMVDGKRLPDRPLMITEFGGIGYKADTTAEDAWGYGGVPKTEEEFKARFEDVFKATTKMEGLNGFVYTQLTDVEQEINGLLTYDRKPKFDPAWIERVVTGRKS